MSRRTSRRLLVSIVLIAGVTVVAGPAANAALRAPAVQPDPVTLISQIQGSTSASPIVGQVVAVEAIVTSLFTTADVLTGFFIQEEVSDYDADPLTSEGVIVNCGGPCATAVVAGDRVRVTGTVAETFSRTQIANSVGGGGGTVVLSSGNSLPPPTPVNLPAAGSTRSSATFEQLEGMSVSIQTQLMVTEFFELARFGHIVLAAGPRPYTYTHTEIPTAAGFTNFLADLDRRRIFLDDDNNDQNDMVSGPRSNEPYPYPTPSYPTGGLSITNRLRAGDTISNLTGVMDWDFAGVGTNAWRIRPIPTLSYAFTSANPAPAAPDPVGGRLRVSAFNVLNYFATVDLGPDVCGPAGGLDCRGADSASELARQRAKMIASMLAMDADVAGLMEIQNDAGASTQDIVAALNAQAGAGTYAFVNTGALGSDAIKVAIIYQPAMVTPVGPHVVLDSSVDPNFDTTRNRPALIQTFRENLTGEKFTIAVNHLKSKGSGCGTGDDDTTTGAGNCNGTRTRAAQALATFLANDQARSGDPDYVIMGDLNSYRREQPITTLTGAGYVDLVERFLGAGAYSYLFDGQVGYLDHALATSTLARQVTGVTEWHVNADEQPLFDYNDEILDAGESSFERESNALPLYEPDPRRSSDHDPIVYGLNLGPAFVPLPPTRLFDTRPTEPHGSIVVAKQRYGGEGNVLRVKVTGVSGIPANGVEAVALNVTVVDPVGGGFATVYPCGARPLAANLNYVAGQTVPNLVMAPVSAAGEVCVFSLVDAHLVADVSGWLGTGSAFKALSPRRLADTRPTEPLGAVSVVQQRYGGTTNVLKLKVTGVAGIPPGDVGAVSLNVTAVDPLGPGFATVFPCGALPVAANMNYVAGQIVPNAVLADVSAQGEVCLYSYADTHFVVDVNGWFVEGSSYTPMTPVRAVDTRPDYPQGAVQVTKKHYGGDLQMLRVRLTGVAGVPAAGVGAVALNVTVVDPIGPGFLTVFPCGTRPLAANLNYVAGQTVPNLVIAPVPAQGEICFFSLVDTHIVIDVNGWFATA